jgi:hypothetical protein
MLSAALTLPGNAEGDARVNDDSICDPLQGSLTIGEVTPVIFRGDLKALAPKEAISAFDTTAGQLALLAAPDARPISVPDLMISTDPRQQTRSCPTDSLAVGPWCSAEIDQTLVSFIIMAAHSVALPVKDGAAVAVCHSGCDPPAVNCF